MPGGEVDSTGAVRRGAPTRQAVTGGVGAEVPDDAGAFPGPDDLPLRPPLPSGCPAAPR